MTNHSPDTIPDFSHLKKNLKKDISGLTEIKIALVGDSATQLLHTALKGLGVEHGFHLNIFVADYNQVYQTVLDNDGKLYFHTPEFVILCESPQKLALKFFKANATERQSFSDHHIEYVRELVSLINGRIKTNIIYFNFPEIDDSVFGSYGNKVPASFTFQLRSINYKLMLLAAEAPNFLIADISSIQNRTGSGILTDNKMFVTTDNVYSIDALPLVAKKNLDVILPFKGKLRKCLITDLDNTLWGGIIGDDGIENIQLGELGVGKAHTQLQQWMKQLKERGIILAVCSKNTEHIAKEPFEKHPDMVLRLDDIAVFVANWDNKADNIMHIQEILNIGYDSMVFLDDNPFERNLVRQQHPEVCVPELPEDAADFLSYLQSLNLFETNSYTVEDKTRTQQYQEEAKRTVLQKSFTSTDDFMKSLQMKAVVLGFDRFNIPRVAQLSQRSNQFNLRTVRYTEKEVEKISSDKNYFSFAFNLSDKFGDYGLISVVVIKSEDSKNAFIENWLMSCRVLKRGMEEFTLNEIVLILKKNGIEKLTGEFIETAKNEIVKNHFFGLGFTQQKDNRWTLELKNYEPKNTFINK